MSFVVLDIASSAIGGSSGWRTSPARLQFWRSALGLGPPQNAIVAEALPPSVAESLVLDALDKIDRSKFNEDNGLDGLLGLTFERLANRIQTSNKVCLDAVAELSAQTSDAAIDLGRIYDDAREVSSSARAVASTVKEMRATIAEISNVIGAVAHANGGSSMADDLKKVAALLGRLEAAGGEVADSAKNISQKASQTELQVCAIGRRLANCETLIEDTFDTAAHWPIEDFGLIRFKADASAWKRRLSSMLLGHEAPQEKPAHLEAAHALFDAGHHGAVDPEGTIHAVAFTDAVDAARKSAETVESEIKSGNRNAATPAYMACGEALEKALAAADSLMKLAAPAKAPSAN